MCPPVQKLANILRTDRAAHRRLQTGQTYAEQKAFPAAQSIAA